MPVGDCQAEFAAAAQRDGISLTRCTLPWINQQGHFGLPARAGSASDALGRVFEALDGDASEQAAKRTTALPGDFIHTPTRTVIEVDESQHFTSMRLSALRLYPADTPLGFDLAEYMKLCERYAPRSDKYRASKEARGFPGAGGRQRQRAYYDSLRDLAVPAMGYPAVVRIPVFDDDGEGAYATNRERLHAILGVEAGA